MTPASLRNKIWRDNNPMMYCYMTLRDNAKRREINFELTFQQFSLFCYETKYIKRKGIYRKNYSIDRKDNTKGYTIDNICIMKTGDNCRKGCKVVEFVYDSESQFKVKKYAFV